jgi:hypothetical protein
LQVPAFHPDGTLAFCIAAHAVTDNELQGKEQMTNRPKRQSEEHVIGREAVKILTSTLPSSWVVREYQPDYGIDLAIELFEQSGDADSTMNNAKKQYDALGEHLFVQVKGSRVLSPHEIRVKPRLNVERFDAAAKGADSQTVRVFSKPIETSELVTVQRMGAALPVLLVLVDVSRRQSFFVCLTDYVDKIILPEDVDYTRRRTKTIYVPESNEITATHLEPLQYYAKRPKLYAAFQKFAYQDHELQYVDDDNLLATCQRFARFLLRSDVWHTCKSWLPIAMAHHNLKALIKDGNPRLFGDPRPPEKRGSQERLWSRYGGSDDHLYTQAEILRLMEIRTLWNQLSNIGRIHEEICREWFLPTSLGVMTSAP